MVFRKSVFSLGDGNSANVHFSRSFAKFHRQWIGNQTIESCHDCVIDVVCGMISQFGVGSTATDFKIDHGKIHLLMLESLLALKRMLVCLYIWVAPYVRARTVYWLAAGVSLSLFVSLSFACMFCFGFKLFGINPKLKNSKLKLKSFRLKLPVHRYLLKLLAFKCACFVNHFDSWTNCGIIWIVWVDKND